MATYYWVGGTGTWDGVLKTNWSLTSGGSGGAGPPTSTDDVIFNASSDVGSAFTVTPGSAATCRNMTVSGLDRVMTLKVLGLSVYGNFSIPATNFVSSVDGFGTLVFNGTGSSTITTNGIAIKNDVEFRGGTWQLVDNFTIGNAMNCDFTGGTIDLNGKVLTCYDFNSTGSTAKVLAHGNGGIINVDNQWLASTATNITTTGTGTISMNGSITCQFAGGGNSYATLSKGGTALGGAVNVTGNNFFHSMKSTKTTGNSLFFFENGSTQTFTINFELSNPPGAWSTSIGSTTGAGVITFKKTFPESIVVRDLGISYINLDPPDGWYVINGNITSSNWPILNGTMMMGLFF